MLAQDRAKKKKINDTYDEYIVAVTMKSPL